MSLLNPFALAVLAAQYAIQAKEDHRKKAFKLKLARLLRERQYTKEEQLEIFIFLDILLYIHNPKIRSEFYESIRQMKGDLEMLVMGNIEEIGYERGITEGVEKGREHGIAEGVEKGREEGIQKGFLLGQIQTLQELLQDPISSRELLQGKSVEELQGLVKELKLRLSK